MQPTRFYLVAAALVTLTVGMSAVASWVVTSATTSSIALAAVAAVHAKDGTNGKDGTDGTAGVNASRSAPIVSPALERFTQVFAQVGLATIPYEPTTCWLQLADGTSLSSVQVTRPNSSAGMSAVLVANGPTAL